MPFPRAIFAAIEELLNRTDANSLSGLLDDLTQNHPDVLALLDAVHAVGSADENAAARDTPAGARPPCDIVTPFLPK